jgi:PAS domain-containing protein
MRETNLPNAVVQQALLDGELHKKLLDQLDTGIYIVDRDRRILYWNGGAERISGYPTYEVSGQFCHGDLLVPCDEMGGVLCDALPADST